MRALITGNVGFIGFIERGDAVVGFDSANSYYDPTLKKARLAILRDAGSRQGAEYVFVRADHADRDAVERCFADHKFDRAIHLGAQAGVHYRLEDPHSYARSNLIGFINILLGSEPAI